MKEVRGRSNKHSRTPSGCLIINNKVSDSVDSGEFENKKRGLDVFEFDEYDGLDDNNNKFMKDGNDGRYKWVDLNRKSGGASRVEVEVEDDEADLPLSVLRKKYRLSLGKAVRLQGKNGVLKVMVKKDKHIGGSDSSYDGKERKAEVVHEKVLRKDDRDGQSSECEDDKKRRSEMKRSVKNGRFVKKVSKVKEKEMKVKRGSGTEKKILRENEGIVKKVSKIKEKEMMVKRGSGTTEKQILREKIKDMLVAGGWTIDYRPRRGRDYKDAVYVNPSGTGYWSIVKAYDAFQKEEEDGSKDGGGGKLTPLREEILCKLTRQGHKSPEIEMKTYARRSRKIGRCSLLVREYDNKAENGDGFAPYSGKRTLLSWLVDSGVVHLREHVEYMNRRKTRALQKGWITKDGIHCSCCGKIVTVSKFEEHAGSKLGQPFLNMFLESGKSMMQCQIDAWNKQGELERKGFYSVDVDGDDPNDDTCGICGDGGDLICCDGCPSTFHQNCLDLQKLPQGDWLCPNCTCKYCELACMKATEASLLTCYFCQKKYHEACSPETDVKPSESDHSNLSFCGHTCHELYSRLQKLVGVKHELVSGFSWSLIHRSELPKDASSVERSQRVECNSMLAVAMSVMDECFLPFTDRRTGVNLIRNVVFNCGSNLSRLNYHGFYTAILERGDEMVCAASIRIHGTQLAEMPFIGTRPLCRRQGMCRRLLSAIEAALSSLQVEKLIIPAVPEHMDTWTDVFGFQPLEESDKQQMKCMNMLVFPKTDMLQKPLVKVKTDSGSREPKRSDSVDESTSQEASASVTSCEPEGMESGSIQTPS